MDYSETLDRIKSALSRYTPRKIDCSSAVPAGVLIPLFNKEHHPYLLLTLRTDTVEHHKGQISFPGGARERGDSGLLHTALREAEEEIGIAASVFTVLGELDDFLTVTNFLVTPFVATMPYPYQAVPNRDEVAELLEIPFHIFLTDQFFEMKQRTYQGVTYPVYFYYYRHYVIWGATAFILNRFVELVFQYNPAPYSVRDDPRNLKYLQENTHRKGKR